MALRVCKYRIDRAAWRGPYPQVVPGNILHVGIQDGNQLCVWALVDLLVAANHAPRTFQVFGTGWELPADQEMNHLGTVSDADGYVWHLFELFG